MTPEFQQRINDDRVYPDSPGARSSWVLKQRGARNPIDPWKPYAFFLERECDDAGQLLPTATIFLTNTECPFRCVMCDLWMNTLEETTPAGAICAQIRYALDALGPARQIKLYNSGSFFDPRAIAPNEYEEIAGLLKGFDRIIVESHPKFLGQRVLNFKSLLGGTRLEVAIGLETAHEQELLRLNKGMTLADYQGASRFLTEHNIALRSFLLVPPPFLEKSDGLEWTRRSLLFAFNHHSTVVSLIPTRVGNGAMEILRSQSLAPPPSLDDLECMLEFGLQQQRGRVFLDLWDLEKFSTCARCFERRRARIEAMNLSQHPLPPIECEVCRSHV